MYRKGRAQLLRCTGSGGGRALQALYQLPLDGVALALNGREAENQFVGCNCGIMDQLISALGRRDSALLIDCRSSETRAVSMPDNVAVVIVNSNVQRGLVDSEYNTRRKQCEEAARFFGVKALRDVSPEQFEARQHQLDPLVAKRARHVISENARTLAAAEALAAGDLQRMGRLMAESHASMRDDFEITVPPIDKLVEIVKATIGPRGGVRMTGGGFGGCIVALMPQDLVETVRAAVAHEYPRQTDGLRETFYVCGLRKVPAYADGNDGTRTRWAALPADTTAKRRRHDGDADGLGRHGCPPSCRLNPVKGASCCSAAAARRTTNAVVPIWVLPSAATPTVSPTPVCPSTEIPCADRQSGRPPAARRPRRFPCPPLAPGTARCAAGLLCTALGGWRSGLSR